MFAGHDVSLVARVGRLVRRSGLALLGFALTLGGGACFTPPGSAVLSTVTGEPITLEQIDPIMNSTVLTEDQKRQELRDLGVPENLIDVLFKA